MSVRHRPGNSFVISLGLSAVAICAAGCAEGGGAFDSKPATIAERTRLRLRAMECLTAAVRYTHNPVVRVEAVEALEAAAPEQSLPWIREALSDEHPAVRFAACVAVGRAGDPVSLPRVRTRLRDADPGVQVAALFALHRLGDSSQTGRLSAFLLHHQDVTVRRNTAMVLGLMGEASVVKLLARAMTDRDAGVRQNVLEAMARLGNEEARQELVFMANAGVGSVETFAVQALNGTGDRAYAGTFRYRLGNALHTETRLAAAAALGDLGVSDGYELALRSLQYTPATIPDPNDPEVGQRLRIRQLAAAALGAIGREDALPALGRMLDGSDPRLQVSAARAILEIVDRRAVPDPGSGTRRAAGQP